MPIKRSKVIIVVLGGLALLLMLCGASLLTGRRFVPFEHLGGRALAPEVAVQDMVSELRGPFVDFQIQSLQAWNEQVLVVYHYTLQEEPYLPSHEFGYALVYHARGQWQVEKATVYGVLSPPVMASHYLTRLNDNQKTKLFFGRSLDPRVAAIMVKLPEGQPLLVDVHDGGFAHIIPAMTAYSHEAQPSDIVELQLLDKKGQVLHHQSVFPAIRSLTGPYR